MSAITQRQYLVRCVCGCYRSDVIDFHAPRWKVIDGRQVLVDCRGREVAK